MGTCDVMSRSDEGILANYGRMSSQIDKKNCKKAKKADIRQDWCLQKEQKSASMKAMLQSIIRQTAATLLLTGAVMAQTDNDVVVETATAPTSPEREQAAAPSVILDEATTDEEIEAIVADPQPSTSEQHAEPTPPPVPPQPEPRSTPQASTTQPPVAGSRRAPAPGTRRHAIETALREALPEDKLTEEADQHVVSQSRMFSVSGGDSLRMGAIATKADEVRGQVCRLLGVDTAWKYGISIRLLGKSTDRAELNPIRTRISIIGQEPNFQIRIYPGGGIDVERLTNAIITMTLFERALCNQRPDSLPDNVRIPHWLITGIQQAVLWRSGKADRRMYRTLFEKADMLSPEEIVSTQDITQLDATSRQVYEASCGVLIMCLINREGGKDRLRELIEESAMNDSSPGEIIRTHFHELGIDGNMLNKWWALELASLSEAPATEMLTPMESEKQLAEVLTILHYDPVTRLPRPVSLDDVYTLTEIPGWQVKVRPCIQRLMELHLRCFPGYRAIIIEYCRALSELSKGATPDDVQNILGPLRELRAAYITTSIRARDYLDWYEITHLGERSHKKGFAEYLEAVKLLRRESPGPDTHLSRYLRDIEELYGLAEGQALPERLRQQAREAAKKRRSSPTPQAQP